MAGIQASGMFSNPGKRVIAQSVQIITTRLEVHVYFLRDTRVYIYLRTRGLHGFDDSSEVKTPFCCIIFATAKQHEYIAERSIIADRYY